MRNTEHGVTNDDLTRYREVFNTATIGMAIVAPNGDFLEVNPALCTIVGFGESELTQMNVADIAFPEDLAANYEQKRRLLSGEVNSYIVEKRIRHREGFPVWIQLSVALVRDDNGEPAYCISQVLDISERREFEEQLLHQAFHDQLTGLPNRGLLLDRLEHALARARRPGETVAVLFLDLDNFKVINDSLGHRAGDRLLIAMAARLQTCVRPGDTVSRLGGDEFIVLLERINGVADAVRVAQRIAEQSLTLYDIGGRQVAVTASIGIAINTPETQNADDLIRDADTAMYEAKRRGRSRYEVFAPRMYVRARERLELEIALQRALERGEFSISYQPVVDLQTGIVNEVEALVRWHSPEQGIVPPEDFMPVAEETGLILGIGEWVLRTACRQLQHWQQEFPARQHLTLSVNLSTRQFLQPTLIDDIAHILQQSGVSPRTLKLEISEKIVMEDAQSTVGVLGALKDLGIMLAIDDFGTGYSSLSYLKRFAVDILKIDRSFVSGIGHDVEDTAIVSAIIGIAKSLGISVIAEGIENAEQLAHLQRLGCDCGQGYYFSPPLPPDQLEAILRQQVTSRPQLPMPLVAEELAGRR